MNGFDDGAVAPLQDAIKQLTIFRALEKNLPEPEINEDSVAMHWDQPTTAFMTNPSKAGVSKCLASAYGYFAEAHLA